ncbi:MAG: shikimate kinase [Marinilabiliales bacterium]|nr:MAG: shikimate kinase [Marinilabiliales bacterium]
MGSGKSVFGKRLAKHLKLNFIDLDKHIEQKYKMTIPSIFSTFDETVFRNLETKELNEILKQDNLILACGGGTPCFNENMKRINSTSISVYLQLNEKALFDRLTKSKTKRPLIQGLKHDELLNKISKLLNEREQFYNQSKLTISGINMKVEEVAQLILATTD